MEEDKNVNFDYAFKYFVDFKEKPEHVYFEHAYNQPSHKKYHSGYVNPAKYLFTAPAPNPVNETSNSGNEHVDVETVGHTLPLFYNSEKINEQVENDDTPEFDDNWMDKVDYRDWNVVKNRLFRSVVQVLEAEYLARLAHKGLRDEAVKRLLMTKKTSFRLRRIYGSVGWEAYTAQWLHGFLLDKLPAAYLKIYTKAFQGLENKVPSHLLEHMTIPSSSLSVRSRILNSEAQNNRKPVDLFSSALAQHKPKKIIGEPLLVLVPSNMGNSFQPNTRPFRLMTELSLLSTLVTVTVPKSSSPVELPVLLEQMISATVAKVIELQADYPSRPIILIGIDAGSLLACHIAHGFNTKITAVVCLGFHLFTMEGKVGKANDKLLKIRTPILFVIGQNATKATIDEVEEFRAKLHCRTGLIVVGGGDDHLKMNHFLKMRCSLTQSVVDRCILNEIAEFLSEIIHPPKVVVSITHISNSDSSKTTATVSSAQAQLLKQLLSESAKKSRATIIKKTLTPVNMAARSQIDHEYGTSSRHENGAGKKIAETQIARQTKTISIQKEGISQSDAAAKIKKLTTSGGAETTTETKGYHRIEFSGTPSTSFTYQIVGVNRKSPTNAESTTRYSPFPVFARKTRGGRRPYQRRTLPPKRVVDKTPILSSYANNGEGDTAEKGASAIENLTPDSLLDLPIVFADENEEENVINDVSLTSYEPDKISK